MPVAGSYSAADVAVLNTRRTPIQKQPKELLCLVGLSRRYFLGDDVYLTFLYDDDRDMDLFNLISTLNPTKVKTGTRPYAAHEVPVLTVTANRVIDMGDAAAASKSSGTPGGTKDQGQNGLLWKIPHVDNPMLVEVAPDLGKEMTAMGPTSTLEGKSLAAIGLKTGSTFSAPASQETPADVSDLDPLSFAKLQSHPEQDVSQKSGIREIILHLVRGRVTRGYLSVVWGMINSYRLDTSDACQDVVDHITPPGYFFELCYLPNADFLSQYNMNLARQVAMGSQLRLRFEQEVRLL
ncbi:hypothetical protein Tco_1573690, partial [Tanacetum coccineum]